MKKTSNSNPLFDNTEDLSPDHQKVIYDNYKDLLLKSPDFDTKALAILEWIVYPMVGPRCRTKDTHDFSEDELSGSRCLVCATYEEIDQALTSLKALLSETIGEDVSPNQYSKNLPTNKYLQAENRLRAELRQRFNLNGGKHKE